MHLKIFLAVEAIIFIMKIITKCQCLFDMIIVDIQHFQIMQCSIRTVKGKQVTYTLGELLGEGQFGKVYRGYQEDDNSSVAIKVIRRNKFVKNEKLKHLIQRQMAILTEFVHQNVITLLEVVVQKQEVCIIYEYCQGGTLQDKIPLPKEQVFHVFTQMVDALLEAESKGIIHRDLKPANILFKNNKVKIADWGFSRLLENGQTTCSFIGSPAYMAPEVLKGEQYTNKADIWSLGVLLYETFTASCPWKSNSIASLYQQIRKNVITFPKDKDIPKFWKDIIGEMLNLKPTERPSWKILKMRLSGLCKSPKNIVNQFQQQKIMSCVFFLEIVQWSRKNLINLSKFDYCIKLIQKNLIRLKYESSQQTELIHILEKQIKVVSSLKRKISLKIMSKKTLYERKESLKTRQSQDNPEGEWQQLIKQTVKYVIDDLQLIYKDKQVQKRQDRLIQLNILLDMVVFTDIPKEYLKKPFEHYLNELQSFNKKGLLKLINYKLQIINKKYYQ